MTPQAAAASAKPAAAKAEFDWQDPLLLDDALNEEERMLRDSAREFCQEKLMTRVLEANRHEHFHREIMNEMGALGLRDAPHLGPGRRKPRGKLGRPGPCDARA